MLAYVHSHYSCWIRPYLISLESVHPFLDCHFWIAIDFFSYYNLNQTMEMVNMIIVVKIYINGNLIVESECAK